MVRSLYFAAVLACLLLQFCTAHRATPGDPVVHTPLGAVRGTTITSRDGRTIYAFRGMRYAKPPLGELRFKAPVPVTDRWDGIKNATDDGDSCPQTFDFQTGPTSEDCLFINVYSTKLPKRGRNPRYPVIFFIHHGAWLDLSGKSSLVGPRYFLDEDIVYVAINYRLGALGFLSTGDSEAPGNNGLKDQLMAMKWVRDNIASFGGNPDLVTLYGYSAGAASVQYHMASPRSAGLFHRAISGSGSALSGWALNRDPMRQARRQAALFNCPHDGATSKQIVDCLRGIDAEELAKSYPNLFEWRNEPGVMYPAVIEAEGSSVEPFLTQDPDLLFQTGNFNQVPWMTGTTNNEMITIGAALMANQTLLEDFAENFDISVPMGFYYERGTPSSFRKSRRLREFYFPDGVIRATRQQITDFSTDGTILYGADRSVKLVSASSRSPVYYYQFIYRGTFGHMPLEPGSDRVPGAAHHDDLLYLFPLGTFPFIERDFPEYPVSKRLVRIWANFARTGNPTPPTRTSRDSLITTNWLPHTRDGLEYMEIGEGLTMKRALRQERAAVWDYIYERDEATSRVSNSKTRSK